MSVRCADGAIWLEGRCLAEDAEALLVALEREPDAFVDVSRLQRLHLAVAQVLRASGRGIRGHPGDPVLTPLLHGRPFSRT